MPRPSKIWFRKDTGWWMVTVGSKKVRLAKGRENRKAAEQKFHELMIVRHTSPEASTARVADIVEAFLDSAKKRCSEDAFRNYCFYAQSFAEVCGKHAVSELKPFHITAWVNGKPWNNTTERNARRVAKRALNWAKEECLIVSNPLEGMKCPPIEPGGMLATVGSPVNAVSTLGVGGSPLPALSDPGAPMARCVAGGNVGDQPKPPMAITRLRCWETP